MIFRVANLICIHWQTQFQIEHYINTRILASTLAPIYKQIIDTSLMTGEIPNNLKYAIINPYLKNQIYMLKY